MSDKLQDIDILEIWKYEKGTKVKLPYYIAKLSAGFPSPADDYIEKMLDLNELIVKHPAATFFVKVEGNSMKDVGIHSGDILIVDRSIEVKNNKIIVAVINGEFTVKRLKKDKGKLYLLPENDEYRPIEISEDMNFQVWGVVTYVIHEPK